jgi:4-hydroxybenzoate polyprenyltransferase
VTAVTAVIASSAGVKIDATTDVKKDAKDAGTRNVANVAGAVADASADAAADAAVVASGSSSNRY